MTLENIIKCMFSLTLVSSILLGCSSYYTPIGSKTVDIKSFVYEDGKLTEVEHLFEKIIYEYEKTENEPKIEFNEWKPKPLTHKGKLKVFWEEELNSVTRTKRDNYYFNSVPEGWQIWFETKYEKALDPLTGKELDLMIGGRYSRFHSTIPSISIGRTRRTNDFVCYNRESKEIYWKFHYSSNGLFMFKKSLYSDFSQIDLVKYNIDDGRKNLEIKRKSDEYKRLQFVYKSDNNLILIYANPSNDAKMGYDIYSFDPVEDKIVKITTIPSATIFFHKKNCVYYYTSQKQIYSINAETYKIEYIGDFREYDDITGADSNERPFLILSNRKGKGNVLCNLETKKLSHYFNNIHRFDNNGFDENNYTVENGIYKGIDPETFEFTWSFDKKEICREDQNLDILLIDSRGILVRVGDEKIVGLRP